MTCLAAAALITSLVACTSINNPFNPRSEVRVLDVLSSEEGRFVGIRQQARREGEQTFLEYLYSEPVVQLENRDGFPLVDFKRFSVKVSLSDGTVLPTKEYPISKGMVDGEVLEIQFPILSGDRDIQSVVFPGDNAPRVTDGFAEIVLYGRDQNGYDVNIPLSVPVSFESTVYSTSPTPASTPAPTPTPVPTATPISSNTSGGQV
ncbi:MAG: hypothetical protein ACO1RX_03970 [Candidatus Sericytochromatia bacterium]